MEQKMQEMMGQDCIFKGTEVKFFLHIEAEGFDMERDDYNLTLVGGYGVRKTITKADILKDADGRRFFTVDTAVFGSGRVKVITTAYVPDADFEDGLRTEVDSQELITIAHP